ncbi:MAG: phosphotransferase family protein, partial [Xenococcaceae cyanobacterium]
EEFPDLDRPPNYFVRGLETIRPGIFGKVTKDNLRFFKLYQRYPNFRQAVLELKAAYRPICLIHNDLKLDNILLYVSNSKINLRIIDWELFTWGDPAYDLGNLLAYYLKIWLDSFLVSADLEWQIALQLATTPLNILQPSLQAIFSAYCHRAPEIWQQYPDFLSCVVQFTGIALIKRIHRNIDEHEPLTNKSICMLQVAKNLLCEPEKSIPTIFGVDRSQLITPTPIPV